MGQSLGKGTKPQNWAATASKLKSTEHGADLCGETVKQVLEADRLTQTCRLLVDACSTPTPPRLRFVQTPHTSRKPGDASVACWVCSALPALETETGKAKPTQSQKPGQGQRLFPGRWPVQVQKILRITAAACWLKARVRARVELNIVDQHDDELCNLLVASPRYIVLPDN